MGEMVMPCVTDTHPLIWHMTGDERLSVNAKKIFEEDDIVIPCIVFYEILYLVERKKVTIDFDRFIITLSSSENYRVEPLCLSIIEKSRTVPREKVSDPWDRLIDATSIYLELPLITRDKSLEKIGLEIAW